MILLFSCGQCGVTDRPVFVRSRHPNEDLMHWMEGVVGPAVCLRHQLLSPLCSAEKLTALKIPLSDDAEYLGQGT